VGAILAIVDADDKTCEEVREHLSKAFGPGGGIESVPTGQEDDYVLQLLKDLSSTFPSAAIAVGLQLKADTVLAVVGGAFAGILTSPTGISTVLNAEAGAVDDPVVDRTTLMSDAFLVLAGKAIAARVDEAEIRQTVQGSMSVDDAAAWLAMLGASRAGTQTTAVVARTRRRGSSVRSFVNKPRSIEASRRPRVPFLPMVMVGVLLGIVLIALLAVGATLITRSTANAPTAPTGLIARSDPSTTVVLSWKATPGSSGYVVTIGGRQYHAKGTSLTLRNVLAPSKTYAWRVYALFGKSQGPGSTSHLTLAKGISPNKPQPTSPFGTVAAGPAGASTKVALCWKYSQPAAGYALRMSGGGRHYNHLSIKPSWLKKSKTGAMCYSVRIPSGARYSWRLGAVRSGYYTSWTRWEHFKVAPAAAPTATVPPAQNGTPTPLPTAPGY
jgi:hypothetical protein